MSMTSKELKSGLVYEVKKIDWEMMKTKDYANWTDAYNSTPSLYFRTLKDIYRYYRIDRLPRIRVGCYGGLTPNMRFEYIAEKTVLPENEKIQEVK